MVRGDGQDLERPAAVWRAGPGRTTVDATSSIHGSRASGSPRSKASSCYWRPAAVPRPPATEATGPVDVGKVMSVFSAAWTAKSDSPGRQVSRRRRVRRRRGHHPGHRRQVRRRHHSSADSDPSPVGRLDRSRATTRGVDARHRRRRDDGAAVGVDVPHQRGRQGTGPPDRSRPAELQPPRRDGDGSAPVPGRRGSWMVAKPSHSNRSRTTGCSKRACTTSHADRARRSSY